MNHCKLELNAAIEENSTPGATALYLGNLIAAAESFVRYLDLSVDGRPPIFWSVGVSDSPRLAEDRMDAMNALRKIFAASGVDDAALLRECQAVASLALSLIAAREPA